MVRRLDARLIVLSLGFVALALTAPPARASGPPLPARGHLEVGFAVGGGSFAQTPCPAAGDGCPGASVGGGGWWDVWGPAATPRLGSRAGGFPGGSPVGVEATWSLEPRFAPRVPAAADAEPWAAHRIGVAILGRTPALPGAASGAVVVPRLGWDLRPWHLWESLPGGRRAEHRLYVHGIAPGVAVEIPITPRFELELSGDVLVALDDAGPRRHDRRSSSSDPGAERGARTPSVHLVAHARAGFGGGRLELAALLRPAPGRSTRVRVAFWAERHQLVAVRPTPGGLHAVRADRLAAGVEITLGWATRARSDG